MDVLNQMLGNDQREQYDDFVSRYDKGAPWDGIGDDEALSRYQQVAPNLSSDQYRESAEEAFRRLTPQQRAEFGRWLQARSRQQHLDIQDLDRDGIDDRLEDPSFLAGATTQARDRQPGLLDGLFGGNGAGGGLLSSPIAKAALAGIAAMAVRKLMGR
jgi:hypothetical protein